jgi:hypothetical protein
MNQTSKAHLTPPKRRLIVSGNVKMTHLGN